MGTGARCSLDSRPRKLGHLPPHHQILPLKSQPQSRSWDDCGGGAEQVSQGSGPAGSLVWLTQPPIMLHSPSLAPFLLPNFA